MFFDAVFFRRRPIITRRKTQNYAGIFVSIAGVTKGGKASCWSTTYVANVMITVRVIGADPFADLRAGKRCSLDSLSIAVAMFDRSYVQCSILVFNAFTT